MLPFDHRGGLNSFGNSTVDPGGPVVIILATGAKFAGSNPDGGDGFFQSVKILCLTYFGREVKP